MPKTKLKFYCSISPSRSWAECGRWTGALHIWSSSVLILDSHWSNLVCYFCLWFVTSHGLTLSWKYKIYMCITCNRWILKNCQGMRGKLDRAHFADKAHDANTMWCMDKKASLSFPLSWTEDIEQQKRLNLTQIFEKCTRFWPCGSVTLKPNSVCFQGVWSQQLISFLLYCKP